MSLSSALAVAAMGIAQIGGGGDPHDQSTSINSPVAAVRLCLLDELQDADRYASSVEYHGGWRVHYMAPNAGNYFIQLEPTSTGTQLTVHGFSPVASKVARPAITACAAQARGQGSE